MKTHSDVAALIEPEEIWNNHEMKTHPVNIFTDTSKRNMTAPNVALV